MYRKWAKVFAIVALVVFLAGCFSSSWTIRLKKDGSGTIRMEYKMDKQVMAMIQGMGGGEGAVPDTSEEFLSESDLDELAAAMGEGVRVVSAEPIPENEQSFGYIAVFEFDDINTLAIDPMEGAPESSGDGMETEAEEAPFTFQFTRGATPELTVFMEQEDDEDGEFADDEFAEMEDTQAEQQQNEQMAEMMKPYFRSMSFDVKIEFDGRIRDTNATYRDGNTVTLVDMDMGKIIDNDELFKAVINDGDLQDEEMIAKLEKAGIQVESQDSIFVRFR